MLHIAFQRNIFSTDTALEAGMMRVTMHPENLRVSAHVLPHGASPCVTLDLEDRLGDVIIIANDLEALQSIAEKITTALVNPQIHGGKTTNANTGPGTGATGEDNVISSSCSSGAESPDDTPGGVLAGDGATAGDQC